MLYTQKPYDLVATERPAALDPEFISGLFQTDGSLFCSVSQRDRSKWSLHLRPRATITLLQEGVGLAVLEAVNVYFGGVGTIHSTQHSTYEITFAKKAISGVILPFLLAHPLMGSKARAAAILAAVINLTDNRSHHDEAVMASILLAVYDMNPATQRTQEDLAAWFDNLDTPTLIKDADPLAID